MTMSRTAALTMVLVGVLAADAAAQPAPPPSPSSPSSPSSSPPQTAQPAPAQPAPAQAAPEQLVLAQAPELPGTEPVPSAPAPPARLVPALPPPGQPSPTSSVTPPPIPPAPFYQPPWMSNIHEFWFRGGHLGYDLNNVRNFWHASEIGPMDRAFHICLGPHDEYSLIANVLMAIRYTGIHNGTDFRGQSFAIERLTINLRGTIISPGFAWLLNIVALTALGQSPFFLDALLAWAVIPRRLAFEVGQFGTDMVLEGTTTTTNLQMGMRALAPRFFLIDRGLGGQMFVNPFKRHQLTLLAGIWNHTIIDVNPIAWNAFNTDVNFLYTLGVDYNHGPTYGVREGDFNYSLVPRIRLSARGLYADIDHPRQPGQLAVRGREFMTYAQAAGKYRGGSLLVGGYWRLQQFIDLSPDLLDFGLHVQAGYFVIKHMLEVSARYSEVWPDVHMSSSPRDLPKISVFQQRVDIFDPIVPPSKMEAAAALRYYPVKDQAFNVIVSYVWRDVDSQFLLQVNGWL